jgi:hypothetical protein
MPKVEGGSADVDDSFAQRGFANIGAWMRATAPKATHVVFTRN